MAYDDIEKQSGQSGLRERYRALDQARDDNTAYAPYVSLGPAAPLGHQNYSVGASVVPLAGIPTGAKRMQLRTLGQPINFRDDGVDPTGGSGFPLLADEWLLYDTEPSTNFKMIASSAATGSADVRIAYYA